MVTLARAGLDPEKDVTWKAFPGDLLSLAVSKGEAQAIAHYDPEAFRFRKEGVVELASNQTGRCEHRVCCVVGVTASLLKTDKPAVRALVEAVAEVHPADLHLGLQIAGQRVAERCQIVGADRALGRHPWKIGHLEKRVGSIDDAHRTIEELSRNPLFSSTLLPLQNPPGYPVPLTPT
ncbi:hypothetical protein J2847_005277 [Azospirillum agricola]|nr:hypothetical protein [Azospirillum agricola]